MTCIRAWATGETARHSVKLHDKIAALAGIAFAAFAVGCGSGRDGTVPVAGEVRFQGQPVAAAYVTFFPRSGRPAMAFTDVSGCFRMRTWNEGDGAVVGEHVVCVTKQQTGSTKPEESGYAFAKNVLPERYATVATSPLRVVVKTASPNEFMFELE